MQLVATEPLMTPSDLRPMAEEVMLALAKACFASTRSLLAFGGPLGLTPDMLAAWVAAGLLHHGTVRIDPMAGTDVEYVALTTKGARELAMRVTGPVAGVSTARLRRSSQKRSHDLAIGDVALTVQALAREGHVELLGLETDEKKFATSVVLSEPGDAPKHVALQADLFLAVRGPYGPSGLLVEVDRGTVSVERMAERFKAYLAWRRIGGPERDFAIKAMRVVTVVPDDHRLTKLMAAALDANDNRPSGFLLFTRQDDVRCAEPERLMGPVACRLGDVERAIPLFDPG